jgi:signal transduction histidine kinase
VAERTAELDSFAYSVAHDLRAPLRSMRGFSEALLEDYAPQLPSEGRDYALRISKAAARMNALIEDLLAYSRLAREHVALAPLDLDDVLRSVIEEMASELLERKAQVTVEKPLLRVIGHPVILQQVFQNLLSNAIKFVAPGTAPQVRIRAEGAGGRVRIWVEDNGIGVAPEHHDRIFRVFERLHSIEDYPGTGIGLAIVRKALDRMSGTSGVDSAPGRGSRFWIELPAG